MQYSLLHEHNECIHPEGDKIELGYLLPSGEDLEQSYGGMHDSEEEEILYPFHVTSFAQNKNYTVVISTVTELSEESVVNTFSSTDFLGGELPYYLSDLPTAIFSACEFIALAYPEHKKLLQECVLSDYAVCQYENFSGTGDSLDNTESVFAIYDEMLRAKSGGKL